MPVDLQKLRHLLAVAEARNFTRAAEVLGLTQPALSRSIALLEAEYGLRIFDRTRTGLLLTPLGETVLAEAKRLLLEASSFEYNLQQLGQAEAGSLAFGMGPLPASIFLSNLLTKLAAARPRLAVQTLVRAAPELVAALLAGRIEFCLFAEGQTPLPEILSTQVFGTIPVGIFVRAGHPLAAVASIGAQDFTHYPVGSVTFHVPEHAPPPQFTITPSVVCENYHILKEVMLNSDMIWLASAHLLRAELANGQAVQLHVPEALTRDSTKLSVVRIAYRTASPGAKLALELLSTQFAALAN